MANPIRSVLWFRTGGFSSPAAPPVAITLRHPIPGWVVRVACASVAAGCVGLLATDRTRWIIGGIVVMMVLIRPGGGGAVTLTLLTGFWVLLGDPFVPQVFPLLLGNHLVIVLSALVGSLPWRGHLEMSTLRSPVLRMLMIQVVAQSLAVMSWWIQARSISSIPFQILGAIGIALITWVAYSRLRETV